MIKTIDIRNYKSVDQLEFELGRVNLFIGETKGKTLEDTLSGITPENGQS